MLTLGEAAHTYVSERKRNRSLAPTSIYQVRAILWRLTDHLGPDRDVSTITLGDVSEWLASINCGPRTKRGHASNTHGLFAWLLLRDEITKDPFVGLQLPRNPDSIPRAFEPEVVEVFFGACNDSREVLIVSLMVQEGLRASEVAGLGVGDVSRHRETVMVREGKGNKDRQVPLTDETRRAMNEYLAEWPPRGAGPLIRSLSNGVNGITPGRVSKIMTGMMYRSGIKQRSRDGISGHALRHTAASDVLERADNDVRVVQKFLGHSSISTSQVYLRAVRDDRLRAAVTGRVYRPAS